MTARAAAEVASDDAPDLRELLDLPIGWTAERMGFKTARRPGYILIRSPWDAVTVDLEKRGFRGGLRTSGRMTSNSKYAGRDWDRWLCAAAVRWLDLVAPW